MAAYGLYTHIASNKFRSMLLLGGLFVLIYVLVFAGALVAEVVIDSGGSVDYYLAAATRDLIKAFPVATIAAALWIVIAYFFHQNIIDAVTGGEDVTRLKKPRLYNLLENLCISRGIPMPKLKIMDSDALNAFATGLTRGEDVTRLQQPRLYNLLENLCISRGIPMPKLKIMDSDALNAFATGLNRRQYSVTVTTGLSNALTDQEIEAVLGHELTHIRNGDVQLMVIAVVIAGVVGFFAELFFRSFFYSNWNFGGGRSSRSSDSDSKSSGGG